MNENITRVFEDFVNSELIRIMISNSIDKDRMIKVKIRPVLLKNKLYFQVSEYIGKQIFHSNDTKEILMDKLPTWFEGLFRQAEIETRTGRVTILLSKKGKVTVKHKRNSVEKETKVSPFNRDDLAHNKIKNYILKEGEPIPFLIDLGVMNKEGNIIKARSNKFRQINRYLEFIEDVLPYLDQDKELTILDFGCGKSYLTFAMYYYLKVLKGYNIHMIGLDLKEDVISKCNRLSKTYGYDKLQFLHGDIASYNETQSVDMVVTLHACDTATDHALYKAVQWGAKVILSVPCCQHELNGQIQNDILEPILKYGIIKERIASLVTDALRAELLETQGYKVQLLEFIDMEHTPKNILIRAVKREESEKSNDKNDALADCIKFLEVSPSLERLFVQKKEEGN